MSCLPDLFWWKHIAVTSDCRRVLVTLYEGDGKTTKTLKVYDTDSGTEIFTMSYAESITALAMTPDGVRAFSALADYENKRIFISIWDLETRDEKRIRTDHDDWIYAVAVTPDGRLGISGSYDTTLKVWNLASGTQLLTLSSTLSIFRAPTSRQSKSFVFNGRLFECR